MTLRADNLVGAVKLNGCQLLATPGGPFSGANVHVQSSTAGCFLPGKNCIDITVQNAGGPTGLGASGYVTAESGACCPQ